MKTFRTLDLSVEFCELVEQAQFPGHLKDQILRASSSVSLNLAEGNAKYSRKDKVRIYQIAMGSLRECQVILRIAKVKDQKILEVSDHLAASIYKMMHKLNPDLSEFRTDHRTQF